MSELTELRKRAASCTACELYAGATQTVFGAGQQGASIVLAGEQPGDQEDRQGQPFVGPAGQLLDRALHQAGISRDDAYVIGSSFRLTHHRGELLEFDGLPLVATIHPSAVLRAPDERRGEMFNGLVADLELAGRTAVSSRGVASG